MKKTFQIALKYYLDLIYFPLLQKEEFLLEGFRYDLNKNGLIEKNGVVFNEMKGYFKDSFWSEEKLLIEHRNCLGKSVFFLEASQDKMIWKN